MTRCEYHGAALSGKTTPTPNAAIASKSGGVSQETYAIRGSVDMGSVSGERWTVVGERWSVVGDRWLVHRSRSTAHRPCLSTHELRQGNAVLLLLAVPQDPVRVRVEPARRELPRLRQLDHAIALGGGRGSLALHDERAGDHRLVEDELSVPRAVQERRGEGQVR